jgi:hypothetical protein
MSKEDFRTQYFVRDIGSPSRSPVRPRQLRRSDFLIRTDQRSRIEAPGHPPSGGIAKFGRLLRLTIIARSFRQPTNADGLETNGSVNKSATARITKGPRRDASLPRSTRYAPGPAQRNFVARSPATGRPHGAEAGRFQPAWFSSTIRRWSRPTCRSAVSATRAMAAKCLASASRGSSTTSSSTLSISTLSSDRETPPPAAIHAASEFIWGMSDYTNHVRKPSRVQRDCHSPR